MVTSQSVEPWSYRQGFNVDSWFLPDTFSPDSDLLAKALRNTVSPPPPPHNSAGVSHPHTKRKRNCVLASSEGKATKSPRRSRASKKPQTKFIATDPSNFRQMVQQVTGMDYTSSLPFAPIVKPEPLRLVNRLSGEKSTAVPTLDTSAFLSNHHQENLLAGGNIYSGSDAVGLPSGKANGTVDATEFDTYAAFPTLESWKVM